MAYEQLRSGALGAPLRPAARFGLSLLLQQGLWAWACAVVDAKHASAPPADTPPSIDSGSMTKLLAELTLPHIRRTSHDAIKG